jgi:hypothetical protein
MKLITETIQDIKVIKEDVGGEKKYFIEGVFLQGDLKNRNGRVYPLSILEKEVQRYVKDFVSQKRAFGELGHPENPTVNMERVSHMILDLRKEGSNFIGKAKIVDTPYGKIVKNLLDEGAKLGVSSRGLGTLTERDGANFVNSDFKLATAADIVADPSAPEAFVRGILESKEWIIESGIVKERQIEEYKKLILSASSRKLEEMKLNLFKDFLRNL